MAKAKTPRSGTSNGKAAPAGAEISIATQPKTKSQDIPASFIATQIDLEAQIRQRAYQLYTERGCTPGQENDDWFRAEQEIRAHLGRHNA